MNRSAYSVHSPYSDSPLWQRASRALMAGALACAAWAASGAWQSAHASNVTWSVGVHVPGGYVQAATPAPWPAPVMVYPAPVVVPAPAFRSYAPVSPRGHWEEHHHRRHHRHPHWQGYAPQPPVVVMPPPRYDRPWQGGY